MLRCAGCAGVDPLLLDCREVRALLCVDCIMLCTLSLVVSRHDNISPRGIYSFQLRIMGLVDAVVCLGPTVDNMIEANKFAELFLTRINLLRKSIYCRQTPMKVRDGH